MSLLTEQLIESEVWPRFFEAYVREQKFWEALEALPCPGTIGGETIVIRKPDRMRTTSAVDPE